MMNLASYQRRTARRVALVLSLAALSVPSIAFAQPITNQRRSVETVFQSGLQSFKKADYETARGEFEYVYAREPKPEVLWNLALAEEKSNRLVDALDHFRTYFTDATVPTAKRDRAKKHIEELYAHTGHLTIRATSGATLVMDGKALDGIPSRPIDVSAGKHVLEAKLGERTRKIEIDATAGATVDADVSFENTAASPAAPATTAALPPPPTAQDLVLPPPRASTEQGFWTTRNTVAVLFGAGAVAAAGVWIGFSVGASSQQSKVDSLSGGAHSCVGSASSDCQAFRDAGDAQRSDAHVATAALIATGAFAVGLGVTLLWPRSSPTTDRAWIAPAVAPGHAGMQLGGRF